MSLRDIEKLEYRLEQSYLERDQLKQQNQALRNEVSALKKSLNEIEKTMNQHPMPLQEALYNPLSSEGKLVQLQEIIKGQTFQLAYLQETNESISVQLTTLQSKLSEAECLISNKEQLIDLFKLKQQEFERKEKILNEQVDRISKKLGNSQQEKLDLINQKAALTQSLKQQQRQNHQRLSQISEGVGSLKDFLTTRQPPCTPKQANDDYTLLKIQQDELQARNEQILRLRTICSNPTSSEETHLKNTIKHLKGELGRFGKLTKQVVERTILAESVIEQYQKAIQKCEQELSMVLHLKQKNTALQNQVQVLRLELEAAKNELQQKQKSNWITKRNLLDVLTENQCYHELMYESYGENCGNYINMHKKSYLTRMEERKQHEKWANIEELVRVNENLRRKLKLI